MKQKYEVGAFELIVIFILGGIITWAGFVVWNDVDYHARCNGSVVSDSWGKNYCLDPELLKDAQP